VINLRSALKPLRSVAVLAPAAGSRPRLPCQTRLKSSSLVTTARDASINASKARPRGLNRPAFGEDREKRRNSIIAGGGQRDELLAMIKIDFFEENHRFSN
jgi:hypothetical protein